MSLLTRFTRSTEAAAPAPVDTREIAYAHSWGFTLTEWAALTIAERTDYRDRVAYAPALQTVGK